MNKIIIIGGGASALMLASLLNKNSVTIIESNPKLGAKLLISGGGKCNISNEMMGTQYYLGNSHFIEPSLDFFNQEELLLWLQKHGLTPELRKDNQYFCKNSASEMMDIFNSYTKNQNILLNEDVVSVSKNNDIFSVQTTKRTLEAKYVVVSSGGLSFPKIGASSIGYDIAESFGHSVKKTAPALVGFTLQPDQFFFKELSGLSTEVVINVKGNECSGSLLFAHKGLSGPAILDASVYWEKGLLDIDFLPNFEVDSLRKSKKQLTSLLPMPKRLTKSFLVQLGLNDKIGLKLSSEEVEKLKTLKCYSFAPAGTFGYSKAEVTKGGVSTNEVDAYTMQSKKEEGLFFLGEVLDVTGRLGGYNFQWAFSSAFMCANYLKEN